MVDASLACCRVHMPAMFLVSKLPLVALVCFANSNFSEKAALRFICTR